MTKSDAEQPGSVSGACLCGAVQFEVELPCIICGHCHCSLCRRAHGAGFVTWFTVPRAQMELLSGEADLTRYRSSEIGHRSFCARCGSSLFFESSRHPDNIDIVLANMKGPVDKPPLGHAFFDCRAEWVEVRDELPKLGGADGLQPL